MSFQAEVFEHQACYADSGSTVKGADLQDPGMGFRSLILKDVVLFLTYSLMIQSVDARKASVETQH